LGFHFKKQQHGKGPFHWSSNLGGAILEIYPVSSEKNVDSATRLGFEVDGITSKLDSLRSIGTEIISEPKESEWGLRAVVQDPDGRSVELLQK
jgi:lactoylglutathione lyase